MRKYALIDTRNDIKKIMIHQTNNEGTYLFIYNSVDDVPALFDNWFNDLLEAEEFVNENFKEISEWTFVEDPLEHCQQDLINPVRVKGRNHGTPDWGKFEKLINGKWKDIDFS